jgi:serine/threonine-protein kinase RsbW
MERSLRRLVVTEISGISVVSSVLQELMHEHSFADEDILDTQLAVEEAVTNVIVHGYREQGGEVGVTCRATRGIVEVQIEDTAPPFDPLSLPEPDLTADIEERQVGGLGIFLIRRVMDGIVYRHENGKNILVLVKRKTA